MQKFESWFKCFTLKIHMQWGKYFCPLLRSTCCRKAWRLKGVELQRQLVSWCAAMVCPVHLSKTAALKQLLSFHMYKPIWVARWWLQWPWIYLKCSTSAVAAASRGGSWWAAGNGKCAAALDSHPPVQQFLAPEDLRTVWKCHLVTTYHHCSASGRLVLGSHLGWD